jgi:membrane associated rhomboid family serine protease
MAYSATAVAELDRPRITPAVQWLIAINVAIYFLQATIVDAGDMQRALGFQMQDLPTFWWKAFTYMFVHGNLWHLAGNMYMLWLFGTRVEHRWSPAAFTRYYVLCGLGAWFLQVLVFHGGLLIGASGAVFGVMVAYAVNWPTDELALFGVIPIKVKWLVAGYFMYDLLMAMLQEMGGVQTGVAHLAHMGGAVTGWLWLRAPSARRLDRVRQHVSSVPDIPDEATPPRAVPRALPRQQREPEIDDVVAKSKAAIARRPVTPPAPRPPVAAKLVRSSDDLDLLLDKISEQGIESLTSDERQLLEAASRKLRETR